ncbi:Nuclease-related domain-containing protein [Gracilibacillus ureilyticus]|uniref:Nuclease-related domain-containing protein n=1 Tax=Gracilibacillus ureilyticus TaxID=531814 RepID=A0A1H9QP76_9BACI|nr:nuclease-related domain-containing protein [Gracilibacillus ureilyticus]SER62381.1 Nuclease-related domain-containing protein [Gracilibacillus ureilyticus]
MILKSPEKTPHLSHLEILQSRSHELEPERILAYGKELAGFLGESSLPYFIDLATLPSHQDLYGLRLPYNGHFFQMDSLLLFRTFLLILEAKHLKGKLYFNEANQLIQLKDSEEESIYDHPLIQAELQKQQLTSLLNQLGYPPIPIYTLVAFTHRKAHLSFHHEDMLPLQRLPFRLTELSKMFRDPILSIDQLRGLGKKLLSLHQDRKYDFITDFRSIRNGVFCPNCKPVLMKWYYGKWICRKCQFRDHQAHISALKDFYYLFGNMINNKQAKWFLQLDSVYTTSRMLNQLELPSTGGYKFRRYDLSPLIQKK